MESFKHVFLIPSDGELPPTDGGLHTAAWGECTAGEANGTSRSSSSGTTTSSTLAAAAAAAAMASRGAHEEANEQRLLGRGVQTATEQVTAAAAAAAAAAVAATRTDGGPLVCSRGEQGLAVEAPRSLRLPDVEELLLSRPAGVQQQVQPQVQQQVLPQVQRQQQEALLEQLLQQTADQQGQHCHKEGGQHQQQPLVAGVLSRSNSGQHHGVGRRAHAEGLGSSKHSSGRGRQGEKNGSGNRGQTVTNGEAESHLALQTALVTMLHLQTEGGLQRKPVFPKRNLMCLSFLRLGACPNRESCNYAHTMGELQKKLELRKTSLCKYWLKGKCENEDCNFAHGEHELQSTVGVFKTTICKYWRQGCCYSGELCRHAHGDADLRPENLPPHLERKKQLQQQCRLSGRNGSQRKDRAAAAAAAAAAGATAAGATATGATATGATATGATATGAAAAGAAAAGAAASSVAAAGAASSAAAGAVAAGAPAGRAKGGDGEPVGEGGERVKEPTEATLDRLRQVICGGILSEARSSIAASSLDSLLAEVNTLKRWDTQGSTSSDLSTDILQSSASESPRCSPSSSSSGLCSASLWNLSPEHNLCAPSTTAPPASGAAAAALPEGKVAPAPAAGVLVGRGRGCGPMQQGGEQGSGLCLSRCTETPLPFDSSELAGAETGMQSERNFFQSPRRRTEPAFKTEALVDIQQALGAYMKSYSSVQLQTSLCGGPSVGLSAPPGLEELHAGREGGFAEAAHCRLSTSRRDSDELEDSNLELWQCKENDLFSLSSRTTALGGSGAEETDNSWSAAAW